MGTQDHMTSGDLKQFTNLQQTLDFFLFNTDRFMLSTLENSHMIYLAKVTMIMVLLGNNILT